MKREILRFLLHWKCPLRFQIALSLMLLTSVLTAQAQEVTVRGQINDETGAGLPGVNVLIKGTATGTTTNVNGGYSLQVPDQNTVLVISFIGYETQEVLVGNRTTINVDLVPSVEALTEVVVVGYGVQRAEAVTGSVVSLSGDKLREIPAATFTQALQGRLPGVEMTQTSTRPGAAMQIRIRGARSLSASNDPLIVLDGVPFVGSINDIPNNDIKSIDILKDASATAIYGSRGANGVILITTNKGEKGQKAKITYNGSHSINKVFAKYPMMSGPEFVKLRAASGRYPSNGADEFDDVDTDWQDLLYRDYGYQTNHNISLSGGSGTGSYNFGIGYFENQGIMPTNKFNRYTLRASVDQEVGERFRFGFTTLNNYNTQQGNQINPGMALQMSPIADPFNPDGTVKRTIQMPLDNFYTWTKSVIDDLGDLYINESRGFATYNSMYGEVEIPGVEGLKYRLNVGLDFMADNSGNFTGKGIGNANPDTESTAGINNSQRRHWLLENLLLYDRTFAQKHSINFTGLFSAENNVNFSSSATARDIPNDAFQYYSLGRALGEKTVGNGGYTQTGFMSYMARVMYEYNDRYFLSATVRSDGASVLAEGHKWHTYPAISAGWNISEESFMQGVSLVNRLKLRVGYGQTSNQAVGAYSTLGTLASRDYNFGNDFATGYFVNVLPNANLGWEFTVTSNVAIDFSLLKNRLSGTLEYYEQKTHDLLLSVGLPETSGVNSYTANVGKTQNKGFEASFNGVIIDNLNGWTWEASLNLFANKNKLVALASGSDRNEGNAWFVGHNINAIYDYQAVGIWQQEDPYLNILEPGGAVGMIKVKYTGGFNPDGTPVRAINADDRQIMDVDPDFQGGLSTRVGYKGFDLSINSVFRKGGIIANTLYSANGYLNLMTGRRGNIKVDYWTPENTGAKFPDPAGPLSGDNPKYLNSLQYASGSYLKFQTISLGYNFNQELIKNPNVRMRMYFTVQNPFVLFSEIHRETGFDPETNGTGGGGVNGRIPTIGGGPPTTRNYLLGVNLTF